MTFTENWFGHDSQQVLASLVDEVRAVPGRVIEIGSWEGRSTVAIANATHMHVHAVDTWEGCDSDITGKLAATRDVHATWRANIDALTLGNVVEHRMDWRRYAATVPGPVALLFIDAEHTYDEVADTITTFLPLMSPGGIICGDDAHHPPVWKAATDHLHDVQRAAALWIACIGRQP